MQMTAMNRLMLPDVRSMRTGGTSTATTAQDPVSHQTAASMAALQAAAKSGNGSAVNGATSWAKAGE